MFCNIAGRTEVHIRRSLPSTGWYAVLALAFVAALGAATVVGAGLSLWRGTAAQRAVGLPTDPLLRAGSGVVTVPARPTPSPSPTPVITPAPTEVPAVRHGQPAATSSTPTAPAMPHARTSHVPTPSTSHPVTAHRSSVTTRQHPVHPVHPTHPVHPQHPQHPAHPSHGNGNGNGNGNGG